jgi:hypothetical protein
MSDRQKRTIEMAQKQLFKKLPANTRRETLRSIGDGFLCDLFEEDASACQEAPKHKVVYQRDSYRVVVYLCAHCVETYDVGDGDVQDFDMSELLKKRKAPSKKKTARAVKKAA